MQPDHSVPGIPRPVRGGVAASLLAEVSAQPKSRLVEGIAGAGGTGKSALLDELEAKYLAAGTHIGRGGSDLDRSVPKGAGAVLIDDAHQLSETALAGIHSLVCQRD